MRNKSLVTTLSEDLGPVVGAADASTGTTGAPGAPSVHARPEDLVVAENDTTGPNIAQVSSSDPEDDEITFSVDNDAFEIVWVGGAAILKVRDGVALDHEATEDGTITLNITATDSHGNTSEATSVTVTVTDINEAPSVRVVGGETPDAADLAIRENTTGPLVAVAVSDPEQALGAGDITVSDPRFAVGLDGAGGLQLELLQGIDAETEDSVTVELGVVDDGGLAARTEVTITIWDVNEPPETPSVHTDAEGLEVAENDTGGPDIARVSSSDPEGDEVTFGVDNDAFEIELVGSAAILKLRDGVATDYEATEDGTITLNITATDGQGNTSGAASVTVTVTDVNEAPSLGVLGGGSPGIRENTTGRVAAVAVSDPEQAFGPADIGVSDPRFEIWGDESSGLWLVLVEAIDAEAEDSVTVELEVVDDGGLAARAEVTITIEDVNEAPRVSVPGSGAPGGGSVRAFIAEGHTGPLRVLAVDDDEDDLGASDITLSDPRFAVETDDSGDIWLVVAEAFDYEVDGDSFNVTITVMDSGGLSSTLDVDLIVTNVNEPPTITVMDGERADGTPAVARLLEDAPVPVAVAAIIAGDQEQGITEADITLSDSRFGLDTDESGDIWLMLNEAIDADAPGGGAATLTVTVTDDGGLAASAEVTVTVENVDEPPTIVVEPGVQPAADGGAGASGAINENATGPVYRISIDDAEDNLTADDIEIDDERFAVEMDSQGSLWAVLVEPVNYEEVESINITLSVRDSNGASATASQTVTIWDVNDVPEANQDGIVVITAEATETEMRETAVVKNLTATARERVLQMKLDLRAMFSDDDGDINFRYHLENAPDWLRLINVQYGEDGSVTGELSGTVPAGVGGRGDEALDIRIVATDEGGARGHVSFNVVVDDGNDAPTGISLTAVDGGHVLFEAIIDENDGSGAVLAHLRVEDQDSPLHPNGQHKWTLDEPNRERFEVVETEDGRVALKAMDGVEFDHEKTPSIELVVTVTDRNGAEDGLSWVQVIRVVVNDLNDPVVVGNEPGDWWVVIDEDINPETVAKGAYLSFGLELDDSDDALPLFTDQDDPDASIRDDPNDPFAALMTGKLTYAMTSGPDWLEIDSATGWITNRAGMEGDELPGAGIYDITVAATDGAGTTVRASFKLAVALSDDGDADNDEPSIRARREIDVAENSPAGTVVATFRVDDDDLFLSDGKRGLHPWSDVTVVIESVMGSPTDGGSQVAITGTPLEIVEVRRDSESIDYEVRVTGAGRSTLDYEDYDEIHFNVRVYDGVGDATDANSDLAAFDFDIDDVNESPVYMADTVPANHSGHVGGTPVTGNLVLSRAVQQQEEDPDPANEDDGNGAITLYLNLTKLFEDPDDDDDDDELTFSISENVPWIEISTGVAEWRDVREGPDGDDGTADDVAWGDGLAPPEDRDLVAILRIDRTGENVGQDANGRVNIRVADPNGAAGTFAITIRITDENLDPPAEARGVTLANSSPQQYDLMRMEFDERVDPDFVGTEAGEPLVELYEWRTDADEDPAGDETLVQVSMDSSTPFTLTQEHVGMVIQGSVVYFELGPGDSASDPVRIHMSRGGEALEDRSGIVRDLQDPATGTITIDSTNDENELVATISIMDPDGIDSATVSYTWESSVNGRGGWTEFVDDDTEDGTLATETSPAMETTAVPESEEGKYVRLVATFLDGRGREESVKGEAIKVGEIATAAAPTITGFGAEGGTAVAVGRTLRLDTADSDVDLDVEWIADGEVIGTGPRLVLEDGHAGLTIMARVTTRDAEGNAVSIADTAGVTVAGGPGGQPGPAAVTDAPVVLLGAAPDDDGELESHSATIDAGALFRDAGEGVEFSFAAQALGDDIYPDQPLDAYLTDAGDHLLIIDERTGEIHYHTTSKDGFGDAGTDGGGNVLEIRVTATETVDGAPVTATNTLRLAVDVEGSAPTGLNLTQTVVENVATTAGQVSLDINIVDRNSPDNIYGQYTWAVDDERFEIMGADEDDTDSSEVTVAVKEGAVFEIDPDDGDDGSHRVMITATPESGNFDPIVIRLTVTITNDPDDDPPPAIPANQVPGLKDDQTGAEDESEDTDEDDDEDGGTPPPMELPMSFGAFSDDGLF